MAKAMLGKWEEAASDLHLAAKLDFDEELNAVLKQVILLNSDMLLLKEERIFTCHTPEFSTFVIIVGWTYSAQNRGA